MAINRYSSDLLIAAASLFVGVSPRSEAEYRRAISTSYYSVFHLLTLDGSCVLFNDPGFVSNYTRLASRSIEHKTAYNKLREIRASKQNTGGIGKGSALKLISTPSQDLLEFAGLFLNLQDQRHNADYNFAVPIVLADAVNGYTDARLAHSHFSALLEFQVDEVKNLIASILFSNKIELL